MKPLHWVAGALLVLTMSIPFHFLLFLTIPCWAVLFGFTRRLRVLDPVLDVALVVAGTGLVLHTLQFMVSVVRLEPSEALLDTFVMVDLIVYAAFLFLTCTAVFRLAGGAGQQRLAKACNVIRWALLVLIGIQIASAVSIVGSGLTDPPPDAAQIAVDAGTLLSAITSLTFVWVAIRSANERWTELPGGVRHGP